MRQILKHLATQIGAVFGRKDPLSLTPAEADKAWEECIDDRQYGAKTGEFTYRPETAADIRPGDTRA